jgi:tetratricopeptide (TPR) repeat protein
MGDPSVIASAPGGQAATRSYRAFLSYSHRDRAFAARLHRQLEAFRVPSRLVGQVTSVGVTPRRLTPIFRDRDELPASADLGEQLHSAVVSSRFLIVVCSPSSAQSRWVEEEIVQFKRAHPSDRVLAVIIGGVPFASDIPGREHEECYPAALRFGVDEDGRPTGGAKHPAAADARDEGDGPRGSLLKLVAGLTGLHLDQLVRREAQRRVQRLAGVAAAAVVGMMVAGGLALYANHQRIVAVREAVAARAATDYLVGAFEVVNPDIENPRAVTALTILNRSTQRARTELAAQPAIQARVLGTLARAYNDLGLPREAQAAVEPVLPALAGAGPDGAEPLLALAASYARTGQTGKSQATLNRAVALLGRDPKRSPRLRGTAALLDAGLRNQASDVSGALAAYDRALAYYRAANDVSPIQIAAVLNHRGLLLSDDGRYTEAEASLQESLVVLQRALGPRHVSTAQGWYALAANSMTAGRAEAAEAQIGKAIEIYHRVLTADDGALLADALSIRGQALQAQGRRAAAERDLRESVALMRRAKAPAYMIGINEVYLALAQSEGGDAEAALATLADARRNYDLGYGRTHPNHGDLLVERAKVLARAGRLTEARHDCAGGIKILEQTLGAEAGFTRRMRTECAGLGVAPQGLAPAHS